MSALRGNIEALEATLGRQNLLVITLTTCRPTDDADFQTRFRKFTRDLNKQNLIWVAKIERQETGGQHAHVVAGQADLDFDHAARMVRRAAKSAGFGRRSVEEVADVGIAELALYLALAKVHKPGRRCVRYSSSFGAVSKWSGNCMIVASTANWRHGVALLAAVIGANDLDELARALGRYWPAHWRQVVIAFGDYWRDLKASPSAWAGRLAFLRACSKEMSPERRKAEALKLAEKLKVTELTT